VVVRNPYDNIARISTRDKRSVLGAAARYEELATSVERTLSRLEPGEALVIHHEQTVLDPPASLGALADHLGVDAPADWIEACRSIVLASPRLARHDVEWSPAERAVADELVERFEFLNQYRFDS
jgi:hypothetical protein